MKTTVNPEARARDPDTPSVAERPAAEGGETRPGSAGVLRNARIVLEDAVVHGSIRWRRGAITDIDSGGSNVGEDVGGDVVVPGLVELHTDHLEVHYAPRPGVRWDMIAAIQAHDAQVATAGITTVFDCLRMGTSGEEAFEPGEMRRMADALARAEAEERLRAEHRLHLRCEVSAANVLADFEPFADDPRVALVSLMDHAPGQRQFASMAECARYYQGTLKMDDATFRAFVDERTAESERHAVPHRRALAERCAERGVPLASHDDASAAHVAESVAHGVSLAEFPTTLEAARASREAGLAILMGAPNVVRGRSHTGNVPARELAALGLLDVLSSDYVPSSLLHGALLLADGAEPATLPDAIALVTANPARVAGLADRGRLAPGLRADLVRVARADGGDVPTVRAVWRAGRRVA